MNKSYISENVHFIGGERDGDVESIHGNWAQDFEEGGYRAVRLQEMRDGVKHVGKVYAHESVSDEDATNQAVAKWAAE